MPLKQPHATFEPDPRSGSFARFHVTGSHPKTLADHHKDIDAIRMTSAVPGSIREEFETTRNLYLYSWYVYEFTAAAIPHALALVEKAIKEKCLRSEVKRPKHQGLRGLLKLSMREGWLTNADFPLALEFTRHEMVDPEDVESLPTIRPVPVYKPTGTEFCERLVKTLPDVRNLSAHGEAGLGFPASALHIIEICACVANALFRNPDKPGPSRRDDAHPRL